MIKDGDQMDKKDKGHFVTTWESIPSRGHSGSIWQLPWSAASPHLLLLHLSIFCPWPFPGTGARALSSCPSPGPCPAPPRHPGAAAGAPQVSVAGPTAQFSPRGGGGGGRCGGSAAWRLVWRSLVAEAAEVPSAQALGFPSASLLPPAGAAGPGFRCAACFCGAPSLLWEVGGAAAEAVVALVAGGCFIPLGAGRAFASGRPSRLRPPPPLPTRGPEEAEEARERPPGAGRPPLPQQQAGQRERRREAW
ncbi:uncharacterized protein [Gorilla gorilla gorilla]|uniref:uncharacterized protein n=1 Tax=Gorilla gorilla gorilla TaxID=9595 RepID=UPI00300857EA